MRIRLSTLAPLAPLALLVPLALLTACGTLAAQSQSRPPSREREQGVDRQARAFLMRADDGDASRARIGIVAVGTGERDTLGVLVSTVSDGGPAAKAGIVAGDRITAINGVNLKLSAADADDGEMQGITARRLTRVLGRLTVGDEVELRFVRGGQPRSVKVKTVAASELRGETFALTGNLTGNMRQRLDRAALGVGLGSSGSRRDTLGIVITSVSNDGPADKAGIEEGDRIAAINGMDLRVPSEDAGDWGASTSRVRRLNYEMEKVKAGDEVELRLYRAGQLRTVKVTTVRARDLAADVRNAFRFEGIGASGLPMLHFSTHPTPPTPPTPPSPATAPTPPIAPAPPVAPRLFFLGRDDAGDVQLRIAPRVRSEVREATRDAMRRLIERREQTRARVRIHLDDSSERASPWLDEGASTQR